jgi:hypothetical protein
MVVWDAASPERAVLFRLLEIAAGIALLAATSHIALSRLGVRRSR